MSSSKSSITTAGTYPGNTTGAAHKKSSGKPTVNVGETERVVSTVGGAGLALYGLTRGSLGGLAIAAIGGALIYRGATGHCNVYEAANMDTAHGKSSGKSAGKSVPGESGIKVEKSVTINKSASELYNYWRNFENLPRFMDHLESVKTISEKRSHWVAKAPLGTTVEWDAEITSEQENKRIGWKSVEDASVPNSGVVEFLPTANRGTEVKVTLTYEPPAGKLGSYIAKLFGEEPGQQVYGDLYRFKSLMESGEIITVEGQTSGRAAKA